MSAAVALARELVPLRESVERVVIAGMCVCICVYVYVCVYMCVCICVCVYIFIYI